MKNLGRPPSPPQAGEGIRKRRAHRSFSCAIALPVYRALGRGAEARQSAYRALFRGALESRFVDALRAATNGGWALGTARFAKQIEEATRRRAAPRLPGRPQKQQRKERRQLALP
jgi:hypothetical protein